MPEGPLGGKRLSNIGPLSRQTEKEVRSNWDPCPSDQRPKEICEVYKKQAIAALESEGVFARCDTLEDINSGRCHNLAKEVKEELPYVRRLKTKGGGHGWVEYRGVHYDAEVPSGIQDPLDFPFFERVPPDKALKLARMTLPEDEAPENTEELIVEVNDES